MERSTTEHLWRAQNGDEAYGQPAVRAEVLRGMVGFERRVAPANLVTFGLLLSALFLVASPGLLALAMAARLGSLALTRHTTARLRTQLEQNDRYRRPLIHLSIALAIAGASWAGLILAVSPQSDPPIAIALVVGAALSGVSLVSLTYRTIDRVYLIFVGSFVLTLGLGGLFDPDPLPLWALPVILALLTGVLAFGAGAARYSREAARLAVENRDLTEWLHIALEEAEHMARHDPLTGLLNRRAFFEDHDQPPEPESARFLLLVDLDHFKQVNDTHGHVVGDHLLKAMAVEIRALIEDLPSGDHAAVRLGGEEFVVVLDGLDKPHAELAAENLRLRVETLPEAYGLPGTIATSASIGLARQGHSECLDQVLLRCDSALYSAKSHGRNQVSNAA